MVKGETPQAAIDNLQALEAIGAPAIVANIADSFRAQWTLVRGIPGTAPVENPTAPSSSRPPAQSQSAPSGPPDAGEPPACHHGSKRYKTGRSAKGEWRAWMCPAPQGTPDQCKPVFLK